MNEKPAEIAGAEPNVYRAAAIAWLIGLPMFGLGVALLTIGWDR